MADYSILKSAIAAVIKQNGNNEITGELLQQALLSMINSLGAGYQFAGIATPTTNPGTPDYNVFYLATDPGVYANFNGVSLGEMQIGCFSYNGNWDYKICNIQSYVGPPTVVSIPFVGNTDLDIVDNNGNVIARFNGGDLQTKNFDSKNTPGEALIWGNDTDLDIVDKNGNVLVRFANGGIKTKNFDSQNVERNNSNCIVYDAKQNDYSGFVLTGWTKTNGIINNGGNYGYNNMAILNTKEFTVFGQRQIFDFTPSQNCVAYFGGKSVIRNTGNCNSLVSVDFPNGTLNIHYGTTTYQITNVAKSALFNSDYINIPFRIVIKWVFRTLTAQLYRLIDNALLATVSATTSELTMDVKGDRPFVFSTGGDISVSNFIISEPADVNQKCLMYICGDSITQGYWATEQSKCYAGLVADVLFGQNKMVEIAGRSSANIDNLLMSVPSEIPALKPKYVMVTIGTNGGNTVEKLEQLLTIIKNNNSIPILNHIPSPDNTRDAVNAMIDSVIADHVGEIYCVKMDVAVSTNYDVQQGMDPAAFADYDHPNNVGHQRMFERVKIDCPFLFNL